MSSPGPHLPKLLIIPTILALGLPITALAAPVTVFNASFTTAEGFTDGVANNPGPGTATMQSQSSATISDSTTTGTYNLAGGATGGNFARSLLGNDPTDSFDEALINGLPLNSTITFTVTGLTIAAVNNPSGNNNVMVFGLANYDESNPGGDSNISGAGARIYVDASGDINAATATTFDPPSGGHIDTTLNLGTKFDLQVILTANGDGTFEVDQYYNGVNRFSDNNVSPNFDKTGTEAAGILQAQGGNGPNTGPPITIEAMSITYNIAVPSLPPHGLTLSPESQDLDGNGLPDVWEALYGAAGIDPNADSDGDGLNNSQEAIIGSDPFDPLSSLAMSIGPKNATEATVTWTALPSRPGLLEHSADLGQSDPWTALAGSPSLNSGEWHLDVDSTATKAFFRVQSFAEDLDADGVPDWLEPYLGFAAGAADSASLPQSYDTTGNGSPDTNLSGDLAAFNEVYRQSGPGTALTRAQAARLLLQTTFGPASTTQVDQVAAIGAEAWINEQIAQPPTLTKPYILAIKQDLANGQTDPSLAGYYVNGGGGGDPFVSGTNFDTTWIRSTITGPDQLRQRVAFALSQILVASRGGAMLANQPEAIAHYYDNFINKAFGNYEDLLLDVALSPFMGLYLSHLGNQKADLSINRYPDENFAREVMQLFSIGLWELNPDGTRKLDLMGEPIPTYDNTDITNLAEVLTGTNYASATWGGGYRDDGVWMTTPMKVFASHHDFSAKQIPTGNGTHHTIPARTPNDANALLDVEDLVHQLVHHPNTAPFISRQLIQFLVTSNPSPAYVSRVSAVFSDNGSGLTGDLEAVVRAILLDEEARNPLEHLATPYFGHFREPTARLVHLARILDLGRHSKLLWWDFGYYKDQSLQEPMGSPSVFNFYRPDFRLFGTLAENQLDSPALGIVNAYSAISFPNYLWRTCQFGFKHPNGDAFYDGQVFPPDLSALESLAGDIPALLDHLSLLYCAGTLGANSRATLTTALASEPDLTERARLAAYLVLIAPEGSCIK